MKTTQYTLAFKSNGKYKTVLPNCNIVKLGKCKLYKTKKAAQKALSKLMNILPIRVSNFKKASKENSRWVEDYLRENEMLTNGVEIVKITLSIED